jgi:hypothetical protein
MIKDTYRFGRRIPLPPTLQILHELLVMSAGKEAKQRAVGVNNSEPTARRGTVINPNEAPERS